MTCPDLRMLAALVLSFVAPIVAGAQPRTTRVATFNVHDLRHEHFIEPDERTLALAQVIQRLDADVLLLNEVEIRSIRQLGPALRPHREGEAPATDDDLERRHPTVGYFSAAQHLVERVREEALCDGCEPITYAVFAEATNTGQASGFDLDNDEAVDDTPGDRTYGGDALGYGEFPGQYGMTLLVRDDLKIVHEDVRTFRTFLWKDMPGALLPHGLTDGGQVDESIGWYSDEELAVFPLSSKSHWDVPVRLPGGEVVHMLCSHPTPPSFDGPENRNGRRNHDEIRFWAEYLDGAEWIVDDEGAAGGLPPGARFVILGDLNADPDDRRREAPEPMRRWLLGHPRVNAGDPPSSDIEMARLDPTDTARFRLRVDYVLPSAELAILDSGVWRSSPGREFPSDHYPVWIDLASPDEEEE